MVLRITFFLILSSFLTSCEYYRVKELIPKSELGEPTSYVMALSRPGLKINLDIENLYWLKFHESDVAKKSERKKVGVIKMNDTSEKYWTNNIYELLEDEVKRLGGNYVVIKNLKQQKDSKESNKLDADVYLVKSIQEFELSIPWNPNRDLQISDFKSKTHSRKENTYISSRFLGDGLGKLFLQYLIQFSPNESSCGNCTEIEILKENIKFDISELYSRRTTKEGIKQERSDDGAIEIIRPLEEEYKKELKRIDSVDNLKELEKILKLITEEILELDTYKNQKLLIKLPKFDI